MGILEKIDSIIEERCSEAEEVDEICDLLNRLLNHITDWTDSDAYPIEEPIGGFKAPFDGGRLDSRQRFVCENSDKKYIYVGVDGSQYTNSGYTKFSTIIYGGVVLHTLGEDGIYKSLKVVGVPPLTGPWDIDRERFIMEAKIAKCMGLNLKGEGLLNCAHCSFKGSCEIKSFDEDWSDFKPVIFMDYPLETSWFKRFHVEEDLDSRISNHAELLRFSNDECVPVMGIVSSSRSRDLYTRILDEIQEELLPGFTIKSMIQTVLEPVTETVAKWALAHKDRYKLSLRKGLAIEDLIKTLSNHKNSYDDWRILRSFCPGIGDRTSSFRCARNEIVEWYPYPLNFFFVNTFPDWTRISYTGCDNPDEVYYHFLCQSAGMVFFYPFVLHRAHHEVAARPELRMLIEDRISILTNGAIGSKACSKRLTV
ncbi:MAG: hypothetical protein ACE5J5_05230 [Candidatus Hydrothermarchaeales archaeon]